MIASEGELKASRALKEAADVIQESPSALQVEPADPERFDTDPDPTFYLCCYEYLKHKKHLNLIMYSSKTFCVIFPVTNTGI